MRWCWWHVDICWLPVFVIWCFYASVLCMLLSVDKDVSDERRNAINHKRRRRITKASVYSVVCIDAERGNLFLSHCMKKTWRRKNEQTQTFKVRLGSGEIGRSHIDAPTPSRSLMKPFNATESHCSRRLIAPTTTAGECRSGRRVVHCCTAPMKVYERASCKCRTDGRWQRKVSAWNEFNCSGCRHHADCCWERDFMRGHAFPAYVSRNMHV